MEEKPKRPFQFSLRTLLIVMAVAAVPISWFSYKADRQRRAVEALRKSGATVAYRNINSTTDPPLAHWRYRVISVWLSRSPTESDVAALQALDGLELVLLMNEPEEKLARLRLALPRCRVQTWSTLP
ncbi:MAG: hypothetical protein K8T25_04110 [Planctomycetia bacterium]|nr:hypothetical protein [Planctomycetia bacterium]